MNKFNLMFSNLKTYARSSGGRQKLIVLGVLLLTLLALLYWLHSQFFITTDNAYVNGNIVQESSQISGVVEKLFVKNNQNVKQHDLLFQLDAKPYHLAMDKAQANYNLTLNEVAQERQAINAAKAEVSLRQADLNVSELTLTRIRSLVKSHMATLQAQDDAIAAVKTKNAGVELARAQLAQAIINLGKEGQENEKVRGAKAELEQAQLNLDYTNVRAATDGVIANLTLREGSMVNAYQPLFAIISNHDFWVDANFKETELEAIHPQQQADIYVDIYPQHHYQGIVESISGGSGTVFSLLPPQNATGNWVKITQRVPVKIRILNEDSIYPLRIGTSAEVKVHINTFASK